jgi:hypothetical protein
MTRPFQLARDYGVVVRLVDFGEACAGQLRAEYDPAVPEIRINLRTAQSLPQPERDRFVERAVGHELYHHREHLGEVATLARQTEREAAADRYATLLLAETVSL